MLDNYNYETILMRVSTRLLQADVHGLLVHRYRHSKKGVAVRASTCSLCRRPLDEERDTPSHVAVFRYLKY